MAGKSDMINNLRRDFKFNKHISRKIINAILGYIKTPLERGEKVVIPSLGTFKQTMTRKRRGFNPTIGAVEEYKPRKTVRFSVSRVFKAELGSRV